jgi:site-specific DNA-methyltransferase (adenine-specific)
MAKKIKLHSKEIPVNKIYCGDCNEVLEQFPDNCIDLVVTSPPYGDLREYEGYKLNIEKLIKSLYRIIKLGGVIVWIVNDQVIDKSESGTSFRQALNFMKEGFKLHDTMIYGKLPGIVVGGSRYLSSFEYMFVFSKNPPKVFNPLVIKSKRIGKVISRGYNRRNKDGSVNNTKRLVYEGNDRLLGNVWILKPKGGLSKTKLQYKHPAIFPEELARRHILTWTNKNDIVLDPMCGSGTTLKMAKQLGRKFIGIDISKKYCELSRRRIYSKK